jgi:hypothetical protein
MSGCRVALSLTPSLTKPKISKVRALAHTIFKNYRREYFSEFNCFMPLKGPDLLPDRVNVCLEVCFQVALCVCVCARARVCVCVCVCV